MPFPRYFNSIILANPHIRTTASCRVPAYLANLFEPPKRRKIKAPELAATGSSASISIAAETAKHLSENGGVAQ